MVFCYDEVTLSVVFYYEFYWFYAQTLQPEDSLFFWALYSAIKLNLQLTYTEDFGHASICVSWLNWH